jgi:hypothetical protein
LRDRSPPGEVRGAVGHENPGEDGSDLRRQHHGNLR